MSDVTRVVQVGMGPLGKMMTPVLASRRSIEIVAAIDVSRDIVGKTLGELTSGALDSVTVTDNLELALALKPDVAVVTTVSELERLWPQIEPIIAAGVNVVSTCEELSYPWITNPDLSEAIDKAAKTASVSVLGTGINPGFLMDFFPIAATAVCNRVDRILIERIQNASSRRLTFRQKIGAGMTAEGFAEFVSAGKIRHVGLTESMHMIATKLGWSLDHTEDVVEPVIAIVPVIGSDWTVEAGRATGVSQIGRGFMDEKEVLTLVFQATVDQSNPRDTVNIFGDPDYTITVPGGTHGDVATCAIIANAVPATRNAKPGLCTMADTPPISTCL